jgi:hypothetical protein
MPWCEILPCRFETTDDGYGRPSLIHPEFNGRNPSLLPAKQIGAVYLVLRPLNKDVMALGVRHLAAGE